MTQTKPLARHEHVTDFLSASDAARLIARIGPVQVLARICDALEADLRRWQDFDKTVRVAAHSPQGVIELMPIANAHDYAFKYVNGHPVNTAHGLPTVMAFGALADVDTGMPRFLSELTLTTALRTAATSVVAARYLARPGSRCMALIGNGSQSEFQALAFIGVLGVRDLRLYDKDQAATQKLVRNLSPYLPKYGASVQVCASTAEAVRGADIVTTLTADKARATILTADMLAPGMHLNAVGGDCPGKTELEAAILTLGPVFVEHEPQSRVEGELQQMPPDFPVTELWQVVQGQAAGRASDATITIFDSVGFALEDYSALRAMHALASSAGLLARIELIAAAPDPKDLFSLIDAAARQARMDKAA